MKKNKTTIILLELILKIKAIVSKLNIIKKINKNFISDSITKRVKIQVPNRKLKIINNLAINHTNINPQILKIVFIDLYNKFHKAKILRFKMINPAKQKNSFLQLYSDLVRLFLSISFQTSFYRNCLQIKLSKCIKKKHKIDCIKY